MSSKNFLIKSSFLGGSFVCRKINTPDFIAVLRQQEHSFTLGAVKGKTTISVVTPGEEKQYRLD